MDPSGTVAVFQVTAYGTVVSSAAAATRPRRNCTPQRRCYRGIGPHNHRPVTDAPLIGDVMVTVARSYRTARPSRRRRPRQRRKSLDAWFFVRVTSIASVCDPAVTGGDVYRTA